MVTISSDNHGPLVNVIIWIVLVPTIIAPALKVYSKWEVSRKLGMDDFLLLIAMVSRLFIITIS